MKKVTGFLIAAALFFITAGGIHFFIDKNIRFDPHSFGSWVSQYKFFAGEEIKNNIDENTILTLGSSEFRHGTKMSSHPANLFQDNSLNMMMVGAGYYQSLFHAVELAAVEDGMKQRKVVLILSPQWFTKEGVLAPAYASRFSEDNYIAMLQNKKLSKKTKHYIMERSRLLLKNDPQTLSRVERYERVFLKGDASFFDKQYVRFYRNFLEEKSKIGIFAAAKVKGVKKYESDKLGKPHEPDWEKYERIAEKEGKRAAKGNPFYVSNKAYRKGILPYLEEKKDSAVHLSYSESPEYEDLKCFLRICKEAEIQPMLVMMPVNGYWCDHIGFPKKERQQYYENIRKTAGAYGAELADFGKKEYEPYFFIDKVHLGWKGWLAVNESIYNFAAKTGKQ